ncbi:PucR family transcriptional regulator [Leucobacter tardus]|uniref:PucR family transcriptional regulator n=1 Tax=Leucobacter tardus TaxID=501483 RepID=A0A939TTA5_9MICO|nr:PucR family transcriptional regulator [Leucobacter tardus]MBO2988470.1 PucR family transcriptional regulator [Leucobacter tardus]
MSEVPAAPLSVRDILELDEMRAGDPVVVAGAEGLERSVRWAHVVAGPDAAALIDGGELILTTGTGWPLDDAELQPIVDELLQTAPAAVVLELGKTFADAPLPLVAGCSALGIPLIALRRVTRFVQITQRVHQLILASQTAALQARAEVHAMLTELGLNRSPVDYVVERLSTTLGAPVVLEDAAHHVVTWATAGGSDRESGAPETVLAAWADRPGRDFALPPRWDRVPVEARGERWGRLTALPGPAHPAGRSTVLELGAFALALARLSDADGGVWLRLSAQQLFDTVLSGRYRRESDVAMQLSAAGLPVDDRVLIGATLTGSGPFGAHSSLERAHLETALRRAAAPRGRVLIGADRERASSRDGTQLLALLSFPPTATDAHGARSSDGETLAFARRLARELEGVLPATTPTAWEARLSLGVPARGTRALITSLERVRAAGAVPSGARIGRILVQQAERQPLAYLVRGFAATPEVQEFVDDTLGPVLEHDRTSGVGHSGDLSRVLAAYLAHPTNRSLAAQQARLSRSVFYQRLDLIEQLLGVDLADGATIATLTVAQLARGDAIDGG